MPSSRSGLYDDPTIYDILHAPGTRDEVDGLEQIEKLFAACSTQRWLEPACGTGRYLRAAARRGIDVVGFDLSRAMIEYAREHHPRPSRGVGEGVYFTGDMVEFSGELQGLGVSMAFNLINTIRHLPSDEAMLAHLAETARVLEPGGIYVIGISLTAYGRESPSEDVWVGARGRVRVTQVVQFIPPGWEGNPGARSERVVSHLSIERPTGTEHRDSAYRLRAYDLEQFRELVRSSPLREVAVVDEVGAEVDPGDGGYQLFVLRRPV